jgi:ABC-2 type transport system permease protein
MKSIIKWTLAQRKTSTIWWGVAMSAFIFINMIFYPSFKNDAAELQKSFENLPDAAVQLFGGSTDFFSPVGFMNSQIFFLMLPMILGILAIALGAGLLAREEQDKTIEGLLARPISRTKLLQAKATAGVIILSIVSVLGLITIIITSKIVGLEISNSALVQAMFVCFLFTLSLGSIAYLMTATGKARGSSIGIAAFVGIGGYLISSLAGTVSWLENPSKLFPFEYYQSEAILRGTYNWNNLWYFVALIGLCKLLSWLAFRRRDLA